jgi:2-polyprenyl-3-methyl-5-hydroxy-6-metoxy-1,4-benzoquinol methylase
MDESHHGEIILHKGKTDIINCKICKFIHIDPIPSEEELLKFYQEEFYQEVKPTYLEKDEKEIKYWNTAYDEKLNILETNNIKSKNILDVGSGGGFFLRRAKEKGWNVLGIEPSLTAAKYAESHKIPTIRDFFEKVDFSKHKKFGAIHMNAVLEHSRSPNKILKISHSLLEKKGMLIVEVPNEFNPLQLIAQKSLQKDEWWIVPKQHVNYFNFKSLSKLLKHNGFEITLKQATFPLEIFLLMGFDYINNSKIGLKKHQERMNFEQNLNEQNAQKLKQKIYQKFAEIGIGRRAIIYAKKEK